MNLNIMSDLHLEFGSLPSLPGGEVLILAGDTGIATSPSTYIRFLDDACTKYKNVIAVMGNHEHYHGDLKITEALIRDSTQHLPNYHLLENELLQLGDTDFIGATLWSEVDPVYESAIGTQMNDYNIVDNCTPNLTRRKFYHSRDYIERAITYREKTVVITHHSPTMKAPEEYRGNILNSAYGSDIPWIEEKGPPLWIHGHTHTSMDYMVGETRVLCNSRGYAGRDVNLDFDVNLEVEV